MKKYFLFFMVVYLFFAHTVVYAADELPKYSGVSGEIEKYLCAPTDASKDQGNTPGIGTSNASANNSASRDLYRCINQLYKFAIILGSSIAVFFVVIAGYIYMSADGNQESVDKAKDILISSITAMVILLGGFLLLKAINPDLIEFKSIQPPSVTLDTSGWNNIPPITIPAGTGTTTPDGSGSSNGMTDQFARQQFLAAGITVNKPAPATNLQGLQTGIAQEIIGLKKNCNCTVIVTGGTEPGHATTGTYNHQNGYKIDLGLNPQLDQYIKNTFKNIGPRSGDNAMQYQNTTTGAIYALETNHWDIVRK